MDERDRLNQRYEAIVNNEDHEGFQLDMLKYPPEPPHPKENIEHQFINRCDLVHPTFDDNDDEPPVFDKSEGLNLHHDDNNTDMDSHTTDDMVNKLLPTNQDEEKDHGHLQQQYQSSSNIGTEWKRF